MRTLFVLAGLLLSSLLWAQEFKPYPSAKITEAQWQQYFAEVQAKHGQSAEVTGQNLVVFTDSATATSYAFTQPGHPAHPAWITRMVLKERTGINIRQIGYFAGKEPPFATLFRAYLELNEKIKRDLK